MSSNETGPDSAARDLAGGAPSLQQLIGQSMSSRPREGDAMDAGGDLQGATKRIKSEQPVATSVQQFSTASASAMSWPPVTMNTAMFLQSIPAAYHNPMAMAAAAAGAAMGANSGIKQEPYAGISSAGSMEMQARPQMMSLQQQQAMMPNQQQYATLQGQPMQTMNAMNMQRQQQQQPYGMSMPPAAAHLLMQQQQQAVAAQPRVDHPCVICKQKDNVLTCAGSCGLHVHAKCIGEDVLFPFKDGSLCGNCFVMQQNRASKEDLRKGGMNGLSVRRAILCLNLETNSHSNFDKFGHLASLRLHEIGEIAGYPIKPFAEKFVEPYLQRWVREKLSTATKYTMNVREIFTFMIGLYSLQKACIAHGLKEQVIEIVKARNLSVTDFLGWHPSIESPQVRCSSLCAICGIRNSPELDQCSRCHRKLVFPTIFTKYASGLLATFYAEQVGIPLGTSCLDVFAHTNTLRASYKGLKPIDPDGVDWETFADQLRMIFGLLDVASNFGVLQLNPRLFDPEVKIIFNPVYVNHAMLATEYEVVGKFLQCMRFFGQNKTVEHINLIVMCERFLLLKQHPNGSWCKANGTTVDQYKATVTCAKALVIPVFRGMGPISPEFQRLLEKWSRGPSSKPQEPHDPKLLACGASVKPTTRASLKNLEAFYKRQATPRNGANALEKLVTARLRSILPSKAAVAVSSGIKIKSDGKMKPENTSEIKQENGDGIKQETTENAGADETETKPLENELKQENDNTSSSNEQNSRRREEDEALTNLSLNEELAIFDGLKFEGGDVIFVNHQLQEASEQANAPVDQEEADEDVGDDDGDNDGTADENDGEDETDADGDTEGVDTVGDDNDEEEDAEREDDMTDEVYDDDDDENDGQQSNEGGDETEVAADETEDVDVVDVNDVDMTEHSELIDPSMDLSLDT